MLLKLAVEDHLLLQVFRQRFEQFRYVHPPVVTGVLDHRDRVAKVKDTGCVTHAGHTRAAFDRVSVPKDHPGALLCEEPLGVIP
jgi:hypothetical protein